MAREKNIDWGEPSTTANESPPPEPSNLDPAQQTRVEALTIARDLLRTKTMVGNQPINVTDLLRVATWVLYGLDSIDLANVLDDIRTDAVMEARVLRTVTDG